MNITAGGSAGNPQKIPTINEDEKNVADNSRRDPNHLTDFYIPPPGGKY
jgi:hypothetical protein